ncbi:unnamed protein product, partial [Adineta steineri]
NLSGADFGNSDLTGAHFSNSDLSGAKITEDQLNQASFENVIMPNGKKSEIISSTTTKKPVTQITTIIKTKMSTTTSPSPSSPSSLSTSSTTTTTLSPSTRSLLTTIITCETITYSQYFTNDTASSTQCSVWSAFLANLTCSNYSSMRINSTSDPVGITVIDPIVANPIRSALRTNGTYTGASNGYTWTVNRCSGVQELRTSGSACSCNNTYGIRPCNNKANLSNLDGLSGLGGLGRAGAVSGIGLLPGIGGLPGIGARPEIGGLKNATCGASSQTMSLTFQ